MKLPLTKLPLDRIYLDMDGIVADCYGAILKKWNRPDAFLDTKYHGVESHLYEYHRTLWGVSDSDFYEAMDYSFWLDIDPTPDAHSILKLVTSFLPKEQVYFLSTPVATIGCGEAKRLWLCKHFGVEWGDRLVLTRAKCGEAYHNHLLIDDQARNTSEFSKFGPSILYPRIWNRNYLFYDSIDYLHSRLDYYAEYYRGY
jgi:5'(3')-deoxyribonucleotidase